MNELRSQRGTVRVGLASAEHRTASETRYSMIAHVSDTRCVMALAARQWDVGRGATPMSPRFVRVSLHP